LPCGWSRDGLEIFNQLAKEVYINRKEHGEEFFDKAFKKSFEQERASTNKTGKRKRNDCINTYNDLNGEGEFIIMDEENSDSKEEEQWVAKNVFIFLI
jgi:hypothetical protein